MACSTKFKQVGENFCNTVSKIARKICCEKRDPVALETYTACRTIALDMDGQGGVRRIGIREVLRRVIGKTVSKLLKADVCGASGVRQTCGGQEGGIEVAIYAATKISGSASTECMLQIKASNDFNNMNRELSLDNAQFICPKIHCYLMNTHQKPAGLFIGKGLELESQEGTTQGDNIAKAYYAIGMKPLMDRLEGENIVQEWFADDAASLGEFLPVKW